VSGTRGTDVDDDRGTAIRSPFAPGAGPFHIKGVAYRHTLANYDEFLPGGFAAFVARLDPAHAQFWRQPFVASAWYDAFPMAESSDVIADILQRDREAVLRELGQRTAKHDFRGVYKMYLKAVSAPLAIASLTRLGALYYDFMGRTSTKKLESGIEIERCEVPKPMIPWLRPINVGYCEAVLQRTGIANIVIETTTELTGTRLHGMALCTARMRIRWS
jgi:hypothetical protein